MNNTPYIDKERVLRESEDYSFLRKRGIEYIEQLAKDIWTDYNVHDPGITTLEMLCYALTDLAYRTNYPIADILEEGESNGSTQEKQFFTAREILTCNPVTQNDYRKVLIDIPGVKNAWLTSVKKEEIVPQTYINCSESKLTFEETMNDTQLSKLHLKGLYKVIIELDEDDELGDLNRNCFEMTVTTDDEPFDITVNLPAWNEFYKGYSNLKNIKFSELNSIQNTQKYEGKLIVEFESENEEVTTIEHEISVHSHGRKTVQNKTLIERELNKDGETGLLAVYKRNISKAVEIIVTILSIIHKKRNLCEDFYQFDSVKIEEVLVCVDVEVASDADIDEVLAEIYYHIAVFLAPSVKFYSIKEMKEKGKTSDEIFEGPILNHGFIDEDEIESSEFKKVIHGSDIIQIIMDVKGVVAVKKLLLSSRFDCEVLIAGERDCLHITKGRATRLNVDRSKIVFYKGLVPYSADKEKAVQILKERRALDRPQMLAKEDYDLPIPKGKNNGIQNYYSIQNDYPLCYGIGIEGIPHSATKLRKAQTKQLKSYLLFYDQILANYFAQLGHVKDLFSVNPELKKTYFSHPLYDDSKTDLPRLPSLLKKFVESVNVATPDIDIDDVSSYKTEWEAFIADKIENIDEMAREDMLEDQLTYEDRRNRFLNHLMARFGEQFTDYVTLMYVIDRMKAPSELIEDKISFLKEYNEISSNRGKAFNYKDRNELWNTENISGFEKRVAKLLGINRYDRRSLAENDCITIHFQIEKKEGEGDVADTYTIHYADEEGKILYSSAKEYNTEEDAKKEMESMITNARKKSHYQIEKSDEDKFSFNLVNKKFGVIARGRESFNTEAELNEAIDAIIKFSERNVLECEGFHLIEHILLRPRTDSDNLFAVCLDKECNCCIGFKDPYSFRVTVIVPYWSVRFQNFDFRKYVESTMRMEAPAHVHVKICWINQVSMKEFEDKYKVWLGEVSKPNPDQLTLTDAQNNLINVLESLRSVYPETRLYDCKEETSNVALLNNSILGSMKEEKNGEM